MKKVDDRLLSAYLDNELTVSEVEELEKQLSSDELKHLVNEKKLESSIGTLLKDAPKCPDVLWGDIMDQVEEKPAKEKKKKPIMFGVIFAAAASIFIYVGIGSTNYPVWVPQSVTELAQKSKIEVDRSSVNRFIAEHGVKLKLGDFPKTHHGNPVNLLGASVESMAGDDVVTLYFACCGEPVKIFLIPNDSSADKFMQEQQASGVDGIVENVARGEYRVAVVSSHNASDLVGSILPI